MKQRMSLISFPGVRKSLEPRRPPSQKGRSPIRSAGHHFIDLENGSKELEPLCDLIQFKLGAVDFSSNLHQISINSDSWFVFGTHTEEKSEKDANISRQSVSSIFSH